LKNWGKTVIFQFLNPTLGQRLVGLSRPADLTRSVGRTFKIDLSRAFRQAYFGYAQFFHRLSQSPPPFSAGFAAASPLGDENIEVHFPVVVSNFLAWPDAPLGDDEDPPQPWMDDCLCIGPTGVVDVPSGIALGRAVNDVIVVTNIE
jgi:hypothetical protein